MSRIVSLNAIKTMHLNACHAMSESRNMGEFYRQMLAVAEAEEIREDMIRKLLSADGTLLPTQISRHIHREFGVFVSAIAINRALCQLGYQTMSRQWAYGDISYVITDKTFDEALGAVERVKPEVTRIRWNVEIVDVLKAHFGIE